MLEIVGCRGKKTGRDHVGGVTLRCTVVVVELYRRHSGIIGIIKNEHSSRAVNAIDDFILEMFDVKIQSFGSRGGCSKSIFVTAKRYAAVSILDENFGFYYPHFLLFF